MMIKGYYTSYSYFGWVGDRYMRFETEQAYLDYISEVEE